MTDFFDNRNCFLDLGIPPGDLATMPHDDEPPDWFIDLWLAASDTDASEADINRFSQVIESDAAARGQLLELAQIHAWLEWLRMRREPTGE